MSTFTYTEARDNLASVWDQAVSTREPVLLKRRGHADVALVSAEELSGLMETAHLLRSPENARRLFGALQRVKSRTGRVMDMAQLRKKSRIDETRS